MKVVGITGGVGAGKSCILEYLADRTDCRIIIADQVAHRLEEPGEVCYKQIVAMLGREIVAPDGSIDRGRMAARIFGDKEMLLRVNEIIHPAVKVYITQEIAKAREEGTLRYLFIEAALLIEDGYGQIVDEMWYIHADTEARRERLRKDRGYSDEKINKIMQGQLSEEAFYRHCPVVIENSGELESVYKQIDEKLGEDSCQKQ